MQREMFFQCLCKRCSDPTEMESHCSTLLCNKPLNNNNNNGQTTIPDDGGCSNGVNIEKLLPYCGGHVIVT